MDYVAHRGLRSAEGECEECGPVVRGWDGYGRDLRREDEAALEGDEPAQVDDAERP